MDMDKNICILCNKKCLDGSERIYCGGACRRDFHSKCVGFTPVSLKLYRENEGVIYECEECRDNPYRMIRFMSIFSERLNRQEANCGLIFKHFETINCELQKMSNERTAEINKSSNTVNDHTMQSASFDSTDETTALDSVVVVKPKSVQKCSATRADLNNKNIPNEIAFSVNNLTKGAIEIKCRSKREQSKLHETAIKELSEDYDVIIPRPRNPKVRITNMSVKQSGVNIIASVKKHNELFKDGDMKVLHVYEIKSNETFGAIMEVDPKTFNIFMREKKVFVGVDVCYVTESISVLQVLWLQPQIKYMQKRKSLPTLW